MIFAASLSRVVPPGQRPLPEGELMTNAAIATIDQVTGRSFTVSLPSGVVSVTLAPDGKVTKQTDVRPEEIKAGSTVSATVVNGVARSIQIQSP